MTAQRGVKLSKQEEVEQIREAVENLVEELRASLSEIKTAVVLTVESEPRNEPRAY